MNPDRFFTMGPWKRQNYSYAKPTRKIDPNDNEVSYEYDALGRPLKVIGPNDSAAYRTTTYSYNSFGTVGSQNIRVGARKVSGAAGVYYKSSYFDGFGRVIKTRADGPAGKYIYTQTRYDLNGRVSAKSLPYFGGGQKRWVETT